MKALVYVSPKSGILDPQGVTVKNALRNLGFSGVEEVRIGKYIEIKLNDSDDPDAQVKRMCDELLHNPLVESYSYEILED